MKYCTGKATDRLKETQTNSELTMNKRPLKIRTSWLPVCFCLFPPLGHATKYFVSNNCSSSTSTSHVANAYVTIVGTQQCVSASLCPVSRWEHRTAVKLQ